MTWIAGKGREAFPCPNCGGSDSKVIDSRGRGKRTPGVRRRRVCACGNRFTTVEVVAEIEGRRHRATDIHKLERCVIAAVRRELKSFLEFESNTTIRLAPGREVDNES